MNRFRAVASALLGSVVIAACGGGSNNNSGNAAGGPTTGVKHYDNIVKPELTAPGNKTIFAESPNNYLLSQNPALDAGVSQSPTRRYMTLSGTSMNRICRSGPFSAASLRSRPSTSP